MADKSMSDNSAKKPTPATVAAEAPTSTAATTQATEKAGETTRPRNENLVTDHGTTMIDDNVVGKIAGIAAREVSGVYNLGGGAARMWGAVRESLTQSTNVQQGVNVAVEEGHASVAVAIIAEYGVAIHELANAIRENVTVAITRMTGLVVDRVDVTVHDVHLPEQETEVSDPAGEIARSGARLDQ